LISKISLGPVVPIPTFHLILPNKTFQLPQYQDQPFI
jgi:hypothetical protein